MSDHTAGLRETSEAYQRARIKAERITSGPREALTEQVRAAYAAGARKADILRAIGHVWSNTWLDKILSDVTPPEGTPTHGAKRQKSSA